MSAVEEDWEEAHEAIQIELDELRDAIATHGRLYLEAMGFAAIDAGDFRAADALRSVV